MSQAEFDRLKAKLDVKNQPWATLPWEVSLTEAREAAAKARRTAPLSRSRNLSRRVDIERG